MLVALAVLSTVAAAAAQAPPLSVRALVQADGRAVWGEPDGSTFLARRARLIIEAAPSERFRLRLLPEFGNGRLELLDAYAEVGVVPGVAVRAGKFKAPVGLERSRAASDLDFPERAFPTQLVPNRDVGLLLRLAPGRQTVELALTNGVPDGSSADLDTDGAKDVSARVTLRPVRRGVLSGLAVGVAATTGAARGTGDAPSVATIPSPGRATVFRYRAETRADGARARVVPQLFWAAGPASVLAEAVASRQQVRLGGDRASLTHWAWQGTGLVVLTGEDAAFGVLRPTRPFAPEQGAWGAVALALRVQRLDLDSRAFPDFADSGAAVRTATAVGIGADWSLSDAVRLQMSAERTVFTAAGAASRVPETAVVGRLQIAY